MTDRRYSWKDVIMPLIELCNETMTSIGFYPVLKEFFTMSRIIFSSFTIIHENPF